MSLSPLDFTHTTKDGSPDSRVHGSRRGKHMSVLVNMDEAERDRQRKTERGQLTDKEQREEEAGIEKKTNGKRRRDMTGGKNAGWRDEGIKSKRWERGGAHGKYAV